ncbi:MAG: LAGLIDADG family homing endonuclease, partial [Candidatus Woesearchaeota archaeon]
MNQKMNVEIAEILGAFIGDGWIEKRKKGVYIMGNKIEDREYYDKFLAPSFSKVFLGVIPKEFKSWKVYGIACYKKEVIEKFVSMGFNPGRKATTVIIPPQIIETKDKEIFKAILRGIFDADGCFWCERSRAPTSSIWKRTYHSHPEFQIGSCSNKLLEQIHSLLKEFDITSKFVLKNKA